MRQANLSSPPSVPVIGAPLATLPSFIFSHAPGAISGQNSNPTANLLHAFPMKYFVGCTIDSIYMQVIAGGANNCHFGLYADNGSRVYPGALLADSGSVSFAGAGLKQFILPVPLQIAAGAILWAATLHSAAVSGVLSFPTFSAANTMNGLGFSVDSPCAPLQVGFGFAALPATFPLGAVAPNVVLGIVAQRITSIP
jgi:hypothetical protein